MPPDDLPPDPFAADAAAQVACSCLAEAFHLVLDGPAAKLICPACKTIVAEFPRHADAGPHRGWPGHPGMAGMAERDTLPRPAGVWTLDPAGTLTSQPAAGGLSVHAAWDPQPPQPPQPPTGNLPPLPQFPAHMCNVILDGGPYHGQAIWTTPDVDAFGIAGVGTYAETSDTQDGKRVFAWQTPPTPP